MNEDQKYYIDHLYELLQDVYRAIEEKDLHEYNQSIMRITSTSQDLVCLDESEIKQS